MKCPVWTVGAGSGTSKQEESQSRQSSDLVTSGSAIAPIPHSQSSTNIVDKFLNLLKREKDEKDDMAHNLEKKKEKIKVLNERRATVEGYLFEKERKIERLEGEAKQMQFALDEERKKRQESEKALKRNERRVECLQDDVYQKETQLKQEKEEKHEKCEKVTELEEQLMLAHTELGKEKEAKDSTKHELDQASKRVTTLQKDVEKANKEVSITEEEKKKIERVLEWMKGDLEDEKEEVKQLNCILVRQKEIMTTYRSIMVFLIVILAALLLCKMGILQ